MYIGIDKRCFTASQFRFYSADKFVTNGWRTGQPSLTTLTMNGFTRNAKHSFSSWKWSNLA